MVMIGIIGNKQVGKDTLADLLCKYYDYKKYSFADPLKKTCKELYDLTDEQMSDGVLKETVDSRWNKTPRQILQFIGTDIVRNHIGENFWIKKFNNWLIQQTTNRIVIPDIRFINELQAVRKHNAIIIKIERSDQNKSDIHISENELKNYKEYDIYINNIFNSKEEYENYIIDLLNSNLLLKCLNK